MGKVEVRPYQGTDKEIWEKFLNGSKNGTFLFSRNYMEYHADRFTDASLICLDEKQSVVALFPASVANQIIVSHGGLTYGGFVVSEEMTTPQMIELLNEVKNYYQSIGIVSIQYKTIPSIYHQLPAEEDKYALFLDDAVLYRRDIYSVIDLTNIPPAQNRRVRMLKRAQKHNILFAFDSDYPSFWQILMDNLQSKHGTKPVHTLQEIEKLHSYFPQNIKLAVAKSGTKPIAGCVIYETNLVAHCQYIGSTEEGREMGGLDALFFFLIEHYKNLNKKYFSFGISNEQDGRILNKGLIEFKEGFGARAIAHDFYRLACQTT